MIPPGADPNAGSSGPESSGQESSGPESAHHQDGATHLPQPPFSEDLIADLHAGVLPPDVAEHIRSRLDADPHARAVLDALDRTTADLRTAPLTPVPVPPDVAAMTRQTLDRISSEVSDGGHPSGHPSGHPGGHPTVVDLSSSARRRRHRWMAAGGLAGAAVIAAVVAISIGVVRSPIPDRPQVAAQSSAPATIADLAPEERVALLAVLGKRDPAPFASEQDLRRCTAANQVPAETVIVGTGPVTLRDREGVVILMSTGVAGRFDVLVVGRDCTTGNPATISRTIIGG